MLMQVLHSLNSEVVIGLGCSKLGQDVQRQLAETGAAGAAAKALQDKIYEAMRSIEDEEGRAALAREIESVLKVVKVEQVWQDKLAHQPRESFPLIGYYAFFHGPFR